MIRLATINDLETLCCYARIVARDMHAHGIDQWSDTYPNYEAFLKDVKANALFVFEWEGNVVGSISLLPENDPFYHLLKWDKPTSLVIHRLLVHPAFRRQKIGYHLFQFAIEKAKKDGYEALKVDTHPDNYRMRSLILKMGFIERGYMPGFHRDGFELVLTK